MAKKPRVDEKNSKYLVHKKKRTEFNNLLRSKNIDELDSAIQEFESTDKAIKLGDSEEAERLRKNIQNLKVRRATVIERSSQKKKRQEEYDKGISASQSFAPRSHAHKLNDEIVENAQYEMVGSRKVAIGGSGNIPLPSSAKMIAPPPPPWPPQGPLVIPSPPPPVLHGSPPPLRSLPPLPKKSVRSEASLWRQNAENVNNTESIMDEKTIQTPLTQKEVRATIDMEKFSQQLRK